MTHRFYYAVKISDENNTLVTVAHDTPEGWEETYGFLTGQGVTVSLGRIKGWNGAAIPSDQLFEFWSGLEERPVKLRKRNKTKTKINVTQDNIDDGTPGGPHSCPVARALADATGQIWWVTSRTAGRGDRFATSCRFFELPRSAVDFIDTFDKGQSVGPFAFTLDLSEQANELWRQPATA